MLYKKADDNFFPHHCKILLYRGKKKICFLSDLCPPEYLPKLFFAKFRVFLVSTAPFSRELKAINNVGVI